MKKILQYLFEHKTLSREMAKEVLVNIGKGAYNEHEVTAFMTVYLMRSITIEELQGFREALLELCVPVDLNGYDVIDIVGTGGDGKNTFNISTLSCFIVAGTGQKVAKHGNYGASSISGASNVMEQVGYKFKNDKDKLKKEIDDTNICFLHAPMFHPALKTVGPIRKNLGMRTFFNMLGPMVNPATPKFQLVGVFSLEMARIYNYLLQQTESAFTIIHGLDGYDDGRLIAIGDVIEDRDQLIDARRFQRSADHVVAADAQDDPTALGLLLLRAGDQRAYAHRRQEGHVRQIHEHAPLDGGGGLGELRRDLFASCRIETPGKEDTSNVVLFVFIPNCHHDTPWVT